MSGLRPGDVDARLAGQAARRLRDHLASHPEDDPVTVSVEVGNDALAVPRPAAALLAQVLQLLARGQGVRVVPDTAMLTTQQAADMLHVSRPYLIGLLDRAEIPHRMVGTHRRVALADLLEYQRLHDRPGQAAAAGLTADAGQAGDQDWPVPN
ncbi:MAG TPA: helix-turn-helix domain-containing protein [Streptosporangiaceae bacterium]|nr:helix-turn-helix domain-containing protein [Streptosporangiaceae bacterium]